MQLPILRSYGCREPSSITEVNPAEASLLFGSGYMANSGIIPALSQEGEVIFSDELNHASIVDGSRLARAEVTVYRHRDIDALADLLEGTTRRELEGNQCDLVAGDYQCAQDGTRQHITLCIVARPEQVGAASGLMALLTFGGSLLAPWFFGALLDGHGRGAGQSGYLDGYLMLASLALAGTLAAGAFWLMRRRGPGVPQIQPTLSADRS